MKKICRQSKIAIEKDTINKKNQNLLIAGHDAQHKARKNNRDMNFTTMSLLNERISNVLILTERIRRVNLEMKVRFMVNGDNENETELQSNRF